MKVLGINNFVFNNEIPVYKKSALLEKTEDNQVKSPVAQTNAFSAGRLWMAHGFQLMGSWATCQAQVEQIQADKVAAWAIATKKANELRDRVEKAVALSDSFKSGANMAKEA